MDLQTVAGRLGHAEGSTTLRFYAQFARPADQAAASLLSGQLAGLRKKEQLRELFASQKVAAEDAGSLKAVAAALASVVEVTLLAGDRDARPRWRPPTLDGIWEMADLCF